MENEEKDILDKLFQSKLHDFEVETDPSDWEAISRRLDKGKSIPFHKAIFYWAVATHNSSSDSNWWYLSV